jgi:NAD(P)-dependent dehydrogenase (short-subunit alcohol dehydrogenase family)
MTVAANPLAGRRALVTGAGSGIGAACVLLLAKQGAAVAALDVRAGAAEDVAGALRWDGAQAVGIDCDVGDDEAVAAAVGAATETLGGLDTVVAAAGIAPPSRMHDLSLEQWDNVIRINLTGVFLTLRHALGPLIDGGGGSVVTIGSVASLVAAGTSAVYDASKGGVLQLTRAVAAEYADDGIRANCVCPGVVETPLSTNTEAIHGATTSVVDAPTAQRTRRPIERRADPLEIAAVVAFLCSDAASFMTGAAVPVDGVYTSV